MHIDYSDISLAHTRMIEICHEVNFQKSVDDNTRGNKEDALRSCFQTSSEMRVLFDEVEGLVEALLPLSATSGSYFIHRGDLHSIMVRFAVFFSFFLFLFFFFVWGADFLFLFFFFVDKGATVDNYYCFLFSNCLIRAVPTKKKAPAWSVVDVVALHSIASVKEIPDMSGIGLSKRKGTCLVLFSLRDVFLFVQKANGFEIGVTRMKGEGFQLEKSDVLAMCAPSARFFSFLEKSFFLTFVGLSEKSAWLAKLGNFLERWRGGEEGARVLLDATLKLLDEHSAPAPVPGLVVFVAMCV
jgi:hypothetical protein